MNGLWGFYEDDKMTVDSNFTEMEYSLRHQLLYLKLLLQLSNFCIKNQAFHTHKGIISDIRRTMNLTLVT